ncbi:MAG: hypothetical protein RMA76_44275 [Deltaproteobacteria bacterium]|jgi:hypothetical protein
MAENADALVAVWDGESRGTRSMIELAQHYGLRVLVLRTDTDETEDTAPSGDLEDPWDEAEERASILEFCAMLPRAEAEFSAGTRAAERRWRGADRAAERTRADRQSPKSVREPA